MKPYFSAMVEKELGEETLALTSEVQIEPRLQIDVEGPETAESFIHNIIRRHTQLLAVILYSRYLSIILFRYIELQVYRWSSWSVLEYFIEHGQKLCVPLDDIMNNICLLLRYCFFSARVIYRSHGKSIP